MRFHALVYRNIFRRPTRSALTVSGVAVAVAAVVALVGIARGFEKSFLAVYEERGIDVVVARAGGVQKISSVLDEDLTDKIAALPEVEHVTPVLTEVMSFDQYDLMGVVVRGVPRDSQLVRDLKVVDGKRIEPGDGRVVMLGKRLAENMHKKAGDEIELIEGEPFRVAGIYETLNLFENSSMVVPLDELQHLMVREGEVTFFNVDTEHGDKATLTALCDKIAALGPKLEATPTGEFVDSMVEIRMARGAAWLTSTIALIVGTIGMINTMLTAVFERTREIALLRAIGWRKRSVVKLILSESVLMGLVGSVVGTLLAIGLVQLLSSLPTAGRMVSSDIAPQVVIQGFALAMLLGLAGGLYPAYRAAQLLPTEGLRHE